jgi:hypothetical protein
VHSEAFFFSGFWGAYFMASTRYRKIMVSISASKKYGCMIDHLALSFIRESLSI